MRAVVHGVRVIFSSRIVVLICLITDEDQGCNVRSNFSPQKCHLQFNHVDIPVDILSLKILKLSFI